MRLLPRSLQARMLLLSAVATLIALAVAGWAIAGVLERFVVQGLDQRLDAEVALLATAVGTDGRIDRARLEGRLGAIEDGPGWRWRIAAPGGSIGSADFPPLAPGPRPDHPPHGPADDAGHAPDDRLHPLDGPGEHGVRVHARQLTLHTTAGPVVLTAAAPWEVVRRPIRAALTPLLATLAALAALMATATLVQLRVGLRPVRRLRDAVAAIRAGRQDRVDEDQPTELRPLAVELNALAADNAAALAAARGSAANLAHALKTPVATLALGLRDDPVRAAQVGRIDATIRHHLARARMDAIDRRVATALAPAVADLAAAVRGLNAGRGIAIETDVAPAVLVAVDPQDLDEMIGNLLDNAARHAAHRVCVSAAIDRADARRVRIAVADDGPGIPADQRARMVAAGTRLDERGDGHGFGLFIASELATLYGGGLVLDDAAEGGLLAVLTVPPATD